MTEPVARNPYGVKLVRGPFLRLPPHPDVCDDQEQLLEHARRLREDNPGVRLAADLFCGGGGLSLGLRQAGFVPVVAVDHYPEAVETHRHHFGGLSVDWDLADADRIEQLAELLIALEVDLIAGGPPCQPFSKAGRSMIRHRVQHAQRPPHDERRDLWISFMEIIKLVQPPAVLMENVPDMALDREMFILRTMVEELEQLGYAVEERVVESWRYGVPQFRQRLILVGVSGGRAYSWPEESGDMVSVWQAIGDLPEVEGGFRHQEGAEGAHPYDRPASDYQRLMRRGVAAEDEDKVHDHITRPVRDDDRRAFERMGPRTRYSELPEEFKRYRDDIFDDKYKRLDQGGLSRTITAHIAKDGYWYIHPTQHRTITVREAARLQSFPDWYRFAGPPSAAFKQIGNAVPPQLAYHLGTALVRALDSGDKVDHNTWDTALELASWFSSQAPRAVPWLTATSRWQVVCGEILLERAPARVVADVWPILEQMNQPEDSVEREEELREIGETYQRERRVTQLLELADWLIEHPGALDEPKSVPGGIPHVTEAALDIASLVVRTERDPEEPVLATKGVLRVAARVAKDDVDTKNRLTDGRLAVARLIGYGSPAREAHKALIEIAADLCRPVMRDCRCDECPLSRVCGSSRADDIRGSRLF